MTIKRGAQLSFLSNPLFSEHYIVSSLLIMKSSTMLLLQLSLHMWTLSFGQTCTSDVASSCSRSKPCRVDHPLEDVECVPKPVVSSNLTPLPAGVTRCPVRWGEVLRCKYPTGDSSETLVPGSGSLSVSVELQATNYKRFAVNMSWQTTHNISSGFEVRIKDDGYLIQCYCINDSKNRLYLDDRSVFSPYSYHAAHSIMDVEVILLTDALPKNSTTASAQVKWPHSCLDIEHNNSTCGLPVYSPPSEVTVHKYLSRSSETILDIQWYYETIYTFPTTYYVEVYNIEDIFDFYTFVVKNTSSVIISRLDSSVQFGVRVQPYVHCSGLANRTYSLGCGLWSRTASPLHITRQKSFRIKPLQYQN